MSWDASLHCDGCGSVVIEQNYTHNLNRAANLALDPGYEPEATSFDEVFRPTGETWWKQLDGMSGPDGAALLDRIVCAFDADPDRYRPLEPDNGWGNLADFTEVLRGLRDAVPEVPSTWSVSG